MNLHHLEKLQEAYMNNLLIPVIGSGLFIPFHLPDWKTLIIAVADALRIVDADKQVMNELLTDKKYLDAIDVIKDAGSVTEGAILLSRSGSLAS